ncbi:MAG: pyridoxamine 5'-phosphate oxidase family protein [Anaerolineales bacterium]
MANPIPSIESAFQVIEAVRQNPNGLTTLELINLLQIPRSTFFTLIQTLKKLGYIEQHQRRGNYFAGPKLLTWLTASETLIQEWRYAFEQEAQNFFLEESLALAFPHNQDALIVAHKPSQQRVSVLFSIGQVLKQAESAAPILFTLQPPVDVRLQGYALYHSVDVIEIGMPVCRDGTHVSAALLLSIPSFRYEKMEQEALISTLRETAARLSYRMGASFYAPFNQTSANYLTNETPLNEQEIKQFLNAPIVARLACLTPKGKPHVVPVWQKWDRGAFYVVAWQGSQWADYLQTNSDVSISIDEPWLPFRRVVARGSASPINEQDYPGGVQALVMALQKRYLGQEFRFDPQEGWNAFRIRPTSLRGWKGLPIAQ